MASRAPALLEENGKPGRQARKLANLPSYPALQRSAGFTKEALKNPSIWPIYHTRSDWTQTDAARPCGARFKAPRGVLADGSLPGSTA